VYPEAIAARHEGRKVDVSPTSAVAEDNDCSTSFKSHYCAIKPRPTDNEVVVAIAVHVPSGTCCEPPLVVDINAQHLNPDNQRVY
jgi:hypothetical protein